MPDYYCGFTPGSPSAQAIFKTAEGGCPSCPGVKACQDAQEAPAAEPTGGVCRVCGCTDDHACEGGCYWVEPDLCSRCAEIIEQEEKEEAGEEPIQEAAPTGDAAVDPNTFDAAARLAIEKGWIREAPVPDPPEAAPDSKPTPMATPAPAQQEEAAAPVLPEKKPRQKRSKPVPAKEQPAQDAPVQENTGDALVDARSKIQAEVGTGNHSYTRAIGNFLLQHLEAHQEDASKILAKDKTIAGSQNEMRKEAEKHRSGSCAVLTDEEGFAMVLKYYGIDGAAPPRPAAPAPPKPDPVPAQRPQKPAVDFDVNLDDLL